MDLVEPHEKERLLRELYEKYPDIKPDYDAIVNKAPKPRIFSGLKKLFGKF